MARLGFNVVRLGVTWSGLEPGRAPANDPAICDQGRPGNPRQFSRSILNRYIEHLRTTVRLLARFHIYTILDMHQDVYNEMFEGEGEPSWAVCTDGVPSVDPPGRWSLAYATSAADIAFSHFWKNNVRGDLQGQYDRGLGRGGACVPFRPLGARIRSLQRAVLHRPGPLPRPTLRRPTRVLLHGTSPRGCSLTRCAAAALPVR